VGNTFTAVLCFCAVSFFCIVRTAQQNRRCTCNSTIRRIRMFDSMTLLRRPFHPLHYGHTFCYCPQLCTYYETLLLLLEPVTKFLCTTITYTSALILLHLSIMYNLKSSPRRNTHFVSADLKSIFRAQFVGAFIIHVHTKFHVPRHKSSTINIMMQGLD
jgi:hypothetical protein